MRDPSTPRVFLSYSRKDGLEFARRVQAMLETEGLSLYRDLSDLEGGADWWRQVETAIKSVEHVVLVLTPSALESRYVRDEWKLARQEGKAFWPVSGSANLNLSHLPRWMARANRHDIHIAESRDRLILGLKGPARQKRVPFMADPLPAGFVERPEKFAEIKKKLLDARGEPVAITAALRGAGGFGKTALANALCHDSQIEDAFSDGILRVTLGERPENLVGIIADLIEVVSGDRPSVTQLDAAKTKLAESLDDRHCLLVIDDVWRDQDLAPFLHRGPRDQTTRLITTRNDRVLPPDAARVAVDAMTSDQALVMLARGFPVEMFSSFRARLLALAERLGEWPLLLGLANGVLRTRIARGSTAEDALNYAERALAQRGLAAFAAQDSAARRSTAWGTLGISLEQLTEAEQMRFAELAVFVEDAEIPTSAVLGLWRQTAGLATLDGEGLLTRLDEMSLLIDLDLGRGLFRLHDVFRNLLRSGPLKYRLPELDGKLMAHFRLTCPDGDLACLKDGYGLRYAIIHLRGAGESKAAEFLLQDPVWMQTKLGALGIQALLADYIGQSKRTASFAIGWTLALAANALTNRPKELSAQLLARLAPEEAPGLKPVMEKVRTHLVLPALVPLRPSFAPSSAELRSFMSREGWVTTVTLLLDERRALSACWDKMLRLWDLDTGAELRRFEGHEDRIGSLAVLADGCRGLSGSEDATMRLWDLKTGSEVRCFKGHKGEVTGIAVLADGRRALSGSRDRTLRLWDLETGAELRRFVGHEQAVNSVTLLPDGLRALSGSRDRTLRLWNLETGAELCRFEGHGGINNSVRVLADGQRVLSGCEDATMRLWNLETGAELRRFEGHWGAINSVTVLPDEQRALSGSEDATIRLWDLETGVELLRVRGHKESVTSVTVLPDGRRALSASRDQTLRLWDLEADARPRRFERHQDEITYLTVLADGRRALSGSRDRTLRLWDLETGAELRRFEGHGGSVNSVSVLADGQRVLSGCEDATIRLWDLKSGAELRRFVGHEHWVTSVTVLAEGKRALSGSRDRTLRLWNLETNAKLRRRKTHEGNIINLTVLPDERRTLSGSLNTGAELRRFEGHENWITSVKVLADERRALSGSVDRTLRLWDLETGAELRRLEGHEDSITSVTVLADERRALSASEDETMRLWDLETGAELRCFRDYKGTANCVTVLAGGRRALSGSRDKTLRLWDLETGAEMRRFVGHEDLVTSVMVPAHERHALSGARDKTLRLWDLETGAELACLSFDAAPLSLAWSQRMAAAVVGDEQGMIHVIQCLDPRFAITNRKVRLYENCHGGWKKIVLNPLTGLWNRMVRKNL